MSRGFLGAVQVVLRYRPELPTVLNGLSISIKAQARTAFSILLRDVYLSKDPYLIKTKQVTKHI